MIKENDRIRTVVKKGKYPAGTIGVVVSVYTSGPACEVELWGDDGYPVDVVTYELSEIVLFQSKRDVINNLKAG